MPCTLILPGSAWEIMSKIILLISIFTLLFLTPFGKVFADVSCQPVYGGGQTCITTGNILISKKVQNPQTGQFVDNLTVNDPTFGPGDTVAFKIFLENKGGATISQTKVVDTLPSFVSFISGPGNFDPNTKNLTFTIDNLNAGETRDVATIQVQVIDAKGLPDGVTCEPNSASATTNTGQFSQTTSVFCIQKTVTTKGGLSVFPPSRVTTTPPTGPELIPLFSLLPGGALGFLLRKKTNKFKGGEK